MFGIFHVFMYLNIVLSKCLISDYFCLFTANVFFIRNKVCDWIKSVSCHSATQHTTNRLSSADPYISHDVRGL